MSRTRGEANRALYRARILLQAWDALRSESAHTADALLDAFLPAVRMHLIEAYGWFLLSVSGIEDSQGVAVPRATGELPQTVAGKARPPELAEFALLERDGWVAQMLEESTTAEQGREGSARTQLAAGLLVSDRERPGYAIALAWADSLEGTMNRMDDSLTEC